MAEKLTPEEIKKALECCTGESPNCSDCPANRYEPGKCFDIVKVQAVSVMNSQQAEIEQWKEEANRYQTLWCEDVQTARAEAIKEFAKKLKDKHFCFGSLQCDKLVSKYAVELFEIDNLVKEMVGDDK